MKPIEDPIAKEKRNEITVKPFPVKLIKGKSMDEKLSYAKAVSASIKGFKKQNKEQTSHEK